MKASNTDLGRVRFLAPNFEGGPLPLMDLVIESTKVIMPQHFESANILMHKYSREVL